MIQYQNAIDAIRAATAATRSVVGWKKGGWVVYPATQTAPEGVEPEMYCDGPGVPPLPVTPIATVVLLSALNSVGKKS